VTFMVLAPEHELVQRITTDDQRAEIEAYIDRTSKRSERERLSEVKTVTGAFTGAYATHPVSGEPVPIWIADYVLAGYGTGAVMAVPGHDGRDHAFAKQFGLEIKPVVEGDDTQDSAYEAKTGKIINSDFLDGLEVKAAITRMLTHLESKGIGQREVQYRLRDAIFSRQRYWGAPIPITFDEQGDNPQAVDTENLPVPLPEVDDFKPTGSGESPLAKATDWLNINGRKRETDTMPGWACSSWYFLRYVDAHNDARFADAERIEHWLPVDFYLGGAEHAVGHLLYSRFWTKVLHDLGHLPFDEPFRKLVNQGMIQGRSSLAYRHKATGKYHSFSLLNPEDLTDYTPIHIDVNFVKDDVLDINAFVAAYPEFDHHDFEPDSAGKFVCDHQVEKMSKRYMNVVNPDDICAEYGADTLRMYEMFLGPLEQHKPWNTDGISGIFNYLKKTWRLFHNDEGELSISDDAPTKAELKHLHLCIKKVQEDIENLSFNTTVSQFMILTNELQKLRCNKRQILEPYLILLSPYAPHFAEELWAQLGHTESILNASFPAFDAAHTVESTVTYPVQINGKVRENIELDKSLSKDEIEAAALALEGIQSRLEGKTVRKVIVVPGKIVNIVAN
ncbi:MAG: leucine--tRNA ligase, partial [Bacteroidota bacterium]